MMEGVEEIITMDASGVMARSRRILIAQGLSEGV